MSSSSTTTPVKRACDSCHRRKVKCIGEGTNPCKNCVSAGLTCTYNAIPQKKGPKGSRAKVLSELRENQRQSQLSGFPPELGYDGRPLPTSFARTPGLLPPGLVENCVEFFFGSVYPSKPVLHRQRIQDAIMSMEHSTEAYCMILSLCAFVIVQSNMIVPSNLAPRGELSSSSTNYGLVVLEEAVRVRKSYDYIENPTTSSILTSYFLYGCYFGLDKDNSAWSYLREATTQAQLLGMHDEETYKTGDPTECSMKRLLFWLLFITERTHALHKHRPISLHPTIHLPSPDEIPTERIHISGFNQLMDLYKHVDDTFVSLWNKVSSNCNPSWLAQLQSQLSEALPTYLDCTEIQAVDLRVSQHWLRTMVWQLCVTQGFVSSMSTDTATTFKYPIEISRDLLTMTHQFSQQAMEVHGVGLIEKLFDIACCLTDVIACIPFSPSTFSLGPRDYLSRFVTLISTLRGGQSRYLPLLLSKISDVLPNLPLPRSLNIPQPSAPPTTVSVGMSPALSTGLAGHSDLASPLPSSVGSVSTAAYPSDLMRQLQAQTSHLQTSTAPSLSLLPPSSRVEDLSLYDSSAPHSTTHSSGSAPPSASATPGPYEVSSSHPHPSHSTHAHAHHQTSSVPSSHSHQSQQHQHQPHPLTGLQAGAYDPQLPFQTFGVGAAMGFQDHDGGGGGGAQGQVQGSGMYTQQVESHRHQSRGGLGHGRGYTG